MRASQIILRNQFIDLIWFYKFDNRIKHYARRCDQVPLTQGSFLSQFCENKTKKVDKTQLQKVCVSTEWCCAIKLSFLLSWSSFQLNTVTDLQDLRSVGRVISIVSAASPCHVMSCDLHVKNVSPFQRGKILLCRIIWEKKSLCASVQTFAISEIFFKIHLFQIVH